MKNTIYRWLTRYLSAVGLMLYVAEEGTVDLNVPHQATDEEVDELDKELGGTEQLKNPGTADGSDNAGDEIDDLTDEEQSTTKQSAEEQEAGTDAERQAIRERKKGERQNQRQRARARIETLERQLANALAANQEIQQRVGNLENTNLGTQAAQLERAAQEAAQAEQAYKDILAEATVKQDGQRAAEATQGLIEMQRRKELIQNARQNLEAQAKQPRQQQSLDAEVVNHAKAFMTKHSWYKGPKAQDMDSRIMSMVDQALTNEGWDPRSPSYWAELEVRAAERLPNRFKAPTAPGKDQPNNNDGGYNAPSERRPQRSPVAGSGSNNSGGGETSTKYTLSPERVKAMKEAGFWDDPKQRESMVKRYKEMDRQLANDRRN